MCLSNFSLTPSKDSAWTTRGRRQFQVVTTFTLKKRLRSSPLHLGTDSLNLCPLGPEWNVLKTFMRSALRFLLHTENKLGLMSLPPYVKSANPLISLVHLLWILSSFIMFPIYLTVYGNKNSDITTLDCSIFSSCVYCYSWNPYFN